MVTPPVKRRLQRPGPAAPVDATPQYYGPHSRRFAVGILVAAVVVVIIALTQAAPRFLGL